MPGNAQILLLHNRHINKHNWDECVQQSVNGLIYAHSFYLDSMSPDWMGLTNETFDWVIPVTCRKKYGIKYLYQPPLTQQLGVFYKQGTVVPFGQILQLLQQRFRFWEVNLNYATPVDELTEIAFSQSTNFILPLNKQHKVIEKKYGRDLVNNLKIAKKHRLIYIDVDTERVIDEYVKHYSTRMPHVTMQDYTNFRNAVAHAGEKNMVVCRQAADASGNTLATVLLLNDGKRLYNLMNTTLAAGRKKAANHFLLNEVIKEFSTSGLVFDFEGSDIEGVYSFYKNFGAVNQPYFMVKYNNLPWPYKLFKR